MEFGAVECKSRGELRDHLSGQLLGRSHRQGQIHAGSKDAAQLVPFEIGKAGSPAGPDAPEALTTQPAYVRTLDPQRLDGADHCGSVAPRDYDQERA
jgi:hypothetical protein